MEKISFCVAFQSNCILSTPTFPFHTPNEDLTQNRMESFDVKISHNKHIFNHSDNNVVFHVGMIGCLLLLCLCRCVLMLW